MTGHHAARHRVGRHQVSAAGALLSAVLVAGCLQGSAAAPVRYDPTPHGPDRLITNEYAHWNPHDPAVRTSPDWDVTSGSLFVRDNVGWTGPPDTVSPDAASSNGTGSSVFRMTTRRTDFTDTTVSLRVRNIRLTDDGHAAPSEVDGIHLFLRWHSEADLYVVSLNRRDDQLVIKKKVTGGAVNGGTYYTLAHTAYRVPYRTWQTFTIDITNGPSHGVAIVVAGPGHTRLAVLDNGHHGPTITGPGAIGLRADNCEFEFDDLLITQAP